MSRRDRRYGCITEPPAADCCDPLPPCLPIQEPIIPQLTQTPCPPSDFLFTTTECGQTIVYKGVTVNVGRRSRQTQSDHGFGPIGSVVAIRYDSDLAVWVLAILDEFPHAADFPALITGSSSFDLLAAGFHLIATHGFTPLKAWFSVSRDIPGGFLPTEDLTGFGIAQSSFFTLSTTCLYVQMVDPIEYCNDCVDCTEIVQEGHGFELPASGVLPIRWDAGTQLWVLAQADDAAHAAQLYVVYIVDDDTFAVGEPGVLDIVDHGLEIGLDYYLSDVTPGAIVPLAELADGACQQKILTVDTDQCLMLNPCCMSCGGVSPEGDDWHILGNAGTVEGVNFIGTTDDVAHETWVNNVRVRRSVPEDDCPTICDGGPENNIGPGSIGCTIGGGGIDPLNDNRSNEIIPLEENNTGGRFSTIGGGSANKIYNDSFNDPDYVFDLSGYSVIGGGEANTIWASAQGTFPPVYANESWHYWLGYNTVSGGQSNVIDSISYSTIGGGGYNHISYANGQNVGFISQDSIFAAFDSFIFGDSLVEDEADFLGKGFNCIVGGSENVVANGIYGSIVSGILDRIHRDDNKIPNDVSNIYRAKYFPAQAPRDNLWYYNTILNGPYSSIVQSHRSFIGNAGNSAILGVDYSSILSGDRNLIWNVIPIAELTSLTPLPYLDDFVSIYAADTSNRASLYGILPPNYTGSCNQILGGQFNEIQNGWHSLILGGAALRVSEFTFGIQNAESRNLDPHTPGDTSTYPQVDISAFSSVGYFGDFDIWIGNTDSTARKLKFFEPNADLDYSTTHYSSFEAQAQAGNIEYVLPAALPTPGQVLTAQTVVGNIVTLEWA